MNESARAQYRAGLDAASRNDAATAQRSFEAALQADPRAYKAAYNLGVLADRAGQENRALEYYRRALQIQPDFELAADGIVTVYLRRNSVPDAIAFIQPLAQQFARNLFLQSLLADTLVRANRAEDAVTAARGALRRDERFVPAMLSLVKANLALGRTELASSVLEQALRIDGDSSEGHFLRARMYQAENRIGDALNEYQRTVQLRPDYSEARLALGLIFLSGGNYPQAVEQLEAASRLSPTLVAVHLNLGDAYRANKQWDQAKASFDKAIQMQDRLPQAHFNMGLLYFGMFLNAPEGATNQDRLGLLQRATEQFTQYRNDMGPQLPRDDPSTQYLEDLAKKVDNVQKRIERDRARAERDAARAAREAARAAAQADAGAAAPPNGAEPAPAPQ